MDVKWGEFKAKLVISETIIGLDKTQSITHLQNIFYFMKTLEQSFV